ncbi:hypothetical protein [Lewinella sp. IMCC34191]|uniref:hypothetical protein n=1 Tax=Lewinella sp. IMCC34191 TaxID=2259172 RepID=UPI000E221B81|nr:hypothetical protein [Lewinella sp. IMCC34191]
MLFRSLIPALLACFPAHLTAQVNIQVESGNILPSVTGRVYEGGSCVEYETKGTDGRSSIDLRVTVPSVQDMTVNYLLNGDKPGLRDILKPSITPILNCETELMSVRGIINSYLVWSQPQSIFREAITGKLDFTDELEVYSPVATTLELPFHASAALAAVQTFCDPGDSRANARARVNVSLGNSKASTGGEVEVRGAFLDNELYSGQAVAVVDVAPGINRFTLHVTGELYVESKVKGVGWALMCGSHAVASSGNSLVISRFTGAEGGPLARGMRITGLRTGIDYLNIGAAENCANLPTPVLSTTPASCGLANGSAVLDTSGTGITELSWSTGQRLTTARNLAAGTYSVLLTYADSCSSVLDFEIEDPTLPAISLPTDTLLGDGDSLLLDASVSGQNLSYAWSTGATEAKIWVTTPGKYSVTVTDAGGCQFTYTARVISDRAYFIGPQRITLSSGQFYDDGGPEDNYRDDRNYVTTICPEDPNQYIELDFSAVDIISRDDQDELSVFDGDGSICPLDASVTGPGVYRSSTPGGCLTVRFRSTSYNGSAAGWDAVISSVAQPATPACIQPITCGRDFTDPGGAEPYQPGEYRVYYLCPEAEEAMELTFQELDLGREDVLAIYDGYGTDCLLTTQPTAGEVYRSSSNGGCLTVILDAASGGTATAAGWVADINCSERSTNSGGSCRCDNNPEPGNTCSEAPLINNLQAFCGSSSIRYTPDAPGNLEAAFTCGVVHNNSFFRFIPTATTATIQFAADGGNSVLCEGFQLAVFSVQGRCDSPDSRWNQLACTNAEDGLRSNGSLSVRNLVPGQTYYLMIDGSYGSECRYTLNALDGIETCPLRTEPETTYCTDGSFYVDIPLAGDGGGRQYKIYESGDYFGELDTLTYVDDGSAQVITVGPYRQKADYDIAIVGGEGNAACQLRVTGRGPSCEANCEIASAIIINCLDPVAGTYLLEGEIMKSKAPVSVYAEAYQQFFLPGEALVFRDTLRDLPAGGLTFEVTDYNYCNLSETVPVPDQCELTCDRFTFSPNPVTTSLRVGGLCRTTDYRLYDAGGRLIGEGRLDPTSDEIDVRRMPVGIYSIIFHGQDGDQVLRFAKF